MPGSSPQGCAVLVKQHVELGLDAADLTHHHAVVIDESNEASEPIGASGRSQGERAEVPEAPKPGLDLAVVNELIPDLGREFHDLNCDVMGGAKVRAAVYGVLRCPSTDSIFTNSRLIDLERLKWSQGRVSDQHASDRDRVDHDGL